MTAMRALITRIMEQHGQAAAFCDPAGTPAFYLKVEVGGLLPLVIERLITPDHGWGRQVVSVCHYGEQNGDAMRDPEMVFDFQTWEPLYYRNDYAGVEQYVYATPERRKFRPYLREKLTRFAAEWARNLEGQGFIEWSAAGSGTGECGTSEAVG